MRNEVVLSMTFICNHLANITNVLVKEKERNQRKIKGEGKQGKNGIVAQKIGRKEENYQYLKSDDTNIGLK